MECNTNPWQSQAQVTKPGRIALRCQSWFWLVAVMVFALAGLSCSFIRMEAPAESLTLHLPTFTRTPLPTLTPTASSPAESVPAPSTPASIELVPPTAVPLPLPTDTPIAVVAALDTPIPPSTLNQSVAPSETPSAEALDTYIAPPPPAPTPTAIANAAAAPAPTKTPIVIPTVTPIPETSGWSFAGVRVYDDAYDGGLLLYGDMVNDTGAPQEVAYITGTFYDGQGQLIADQESTTEYWPVEVIPPGGRVPFELTVNDIQASANYRLWVNSAASNKSPRQDFSFEGVEQWSEDEQYCLAGQAQKSGGALSEYLVIAAVLYDDQGNVINFSEAVESDPERLSSDDPLDFEICIDSPNQNAARHELRAWGQ